MSKRLSANYPSPPVLPEPDPPGSRRAWGKIPYEERFRAQRRELLDAAASLAAEHGVAATTVANITTTAGLAKRVFYEHFEDKEACFVELVRQFGAGQLRAGIAAAESCEGASAFETMRSVIRTLVTYRADDPRVVVAIRSEVQLGSALADAFRDQRELIADLLVAVALQLGSELPHPTIRLAALLLVNGVIDLGPELRDRRDALREITTIVCLAFALPV